MMKKQMLVPAILCLFHCCAIAQVSGVIKDSQNGTLLENALIFINKTSLSSSTNAAGEFSITGIKPGYSELVVYKTGYQLFKSPILVKEGRASRVPLQLTPEQAFDISNPIKNTKERANDLSLLEHELVGTGADVLHCKILNESSISIGKSGKEVSYSIDGPIILANPYSGYKIYFYPHSDHNIRHVLNDMVVRFDTIPPHDAAQAEEWKLARENSFLGSARHLFAAIAQNQIGAQGFMLLSEKGDTLRRQDFVEPESVSGYTVVKLSGKTKVIYDPGHFDPRISWIITEGNFSINGQGILLNDKAVEIDGEMKISGISKVVPSDFYPAATLNSKVESAEIIKLFQEKIYAQTDKSYYYPGEIIWIKAYLNYAEPELRDTLSKVMYVELIGPSKEIILSKMLRIDSGRVWGEMVVPEAAASGDYQLRAYTNLMKNFDIKNVFRKAIPILDSKDKIDNATGKEETSSIGGLSVTTDKQVYKVRDEIRLSINMIDTDQERGSVNLSLAVTDAEQVTPIIESVSIIKNFPFTNGIQNELPDFLQYPAEQGISLVGQFVNDDGKKEAATITLLEGLAEPSIIQTGKDGRFLQSGFEFYDSLTLAWEARDKKGAPYGRISLVPKEPLPVSGIKPLSLQLIHTQTRQRVMDNDLNGTRTLQEVSFTNPKIKNSEFIAQKFGMGSRNRIFKGEQFKGNDMAEALAIAIPSLKISGNGGKRKLAFPFQDMSSSFTRKKRPSKEPLIYYNDGFIGGGPQSAVTALMNISPSQVDHVEVIYGNPTNRLIEIQGGYGLIAIYSKKDALAKGFKKVTIPGYSLPRQFQSPDYGGQNESNSQRDFRSTIYWNPNIRISTSPNPTAVTFYAADLPGKYRVVAEGVTANGLPVRSEFYFEVRE